MNTISSAIIEGRLDRYADELETSLRYSGQIMESLPLSLGDTSIQREILSDGSRGDVTITTQEWDDPSGRMVTYRRYALKDGRLFRADFGEDERPIGKIRTVQLLAKIAFGKVDHWDRESDYYGVEEEK